MMELCIYADGACSGNQHDKNIGGWGAVLEYGKHTKKLSGGEANTTNNRMELTAVISAFEALTQEGLRISIYSDSSYIVNCLKQKWYKKWQTNGWHTTSKTPVENRDLWERLLLLIEKHDCRFFLIKGHLNLDGSEAVLRKAFAKYKTGNGENISYDRFISIAKMNCLADKLANEGIEKIRNP